jgi:hypothetical protein
MGIEDALDLVQASPGSYAEAMQESGHAAEPVQPGAWSPLQYLWHMVDVLRIGTERLWTVMLDPASGIAGWDENTLAAVRRYDEQSVAVGLRAYEYAERTWREAAQEVPVDATTTHRAFGVVTAADVILRNTHECHHHLTDIRKGRRSQNPV